MTFLRTEGRIQPVIPGPNEKGQVHFRVDLDIVIELDGRNLKYEARWPRGEGGKTLAEFPNSIELGKLGPGQDPNNDGALNYMFNK